MSIRKRALSLLLVLVMLLGVLPAGAAAAEVYQDVPSGHWASDYIARVAEQGLMVGTSDTTFAPEETITRAMFVTILARYAKAETDNNAETAFTDVPAGSWYYGAAAYAYNNGLFAGTTDTTFAPDMTMTRAMLVSVLWRLAGEPAPKGTNTFDDVPNGTWYTDAVTWAAENGVVAGIGNGRFDPDGSVTREQTAVILFNYAQSKGYDVSARADLSVFPDAGSVSGWAQDALAWANASGLISGAVRGTQTILNPQGSASRAQVAMILMGYVEHVVNA